MVFATDLSEAEIQRAIFKYRGIKLHEGKSERIIWIFGYEVPLEKATRGKCVALMGYDKDHNLYIIELKGKDSKDKDEIPKKINEYEKIVANPEVKSCLEKEFSDTFFFPLNFKFKLIKKLIIAPDKFYEGKEGLLADDTVSYGFFKDEDIKSIKENAFLMGFFKIYHITLLKN